MNFIEKMSFYNVLKKAIVLRSIQKSGTNYLRLLLCNYICNIDTYVNNNSFTRISYNEIQNNIFPNVRGNISNGSSKYIKPKIQSTIFKEKYSDFMYDHGCKLDRITFLDPKKLILIYRNPFDVIISRYFYNFKNRIGQQDVFSHPREVVDKFLPSFIKSYNWMKKKHNNNKSNTILISYEQLFLQPESTLTSIINFLGFEIYPELIYLSSQASSIKETKKEEEQNGSAIHSPKEGITGSFARSGKIGQWTHYFTYEDFCKICTHLQDKKIDYREFWITPDGSSLPHEYSRAVHQELA